VVLSVEEEPMVRFACAVVVLFALAPLGAAPVPKAKPTPRDQKPNTNALLKKHQGSLKYGGSSQWGGWQFDKAFDDKLDTSWFSAAGDCKAQNKEPAVEVTFPEDVAVSRVTVYGNREPSWPTGYTAHAGRVELVDKDGKVLLTLKKEASGDKKDFDFLLADAFDRVRTVRFVSTNDDTAAGGGNGCIAIAEVHVE
jgi:hypothetical protein